MPSEHVSPQPSGMRVGVNVGVNVGVVVGVNGGVDVDVNSGVGVRVGVDVGVRVAVGLGVFVGETGVGVRVGVGAVYEHVNNPPQVLHKPFCGGQSEAPVQIKFEHVEQ